MHDKHRWFKITDKSKVSESCVNALIEAGIEKASTTLILTRKHELNVESGRISLLRTTDDVELHMMGITDQRMGTTSINKTDSFSIGKAISELEVLIDSSDSDPANEIAEKQPQESFSRGPEKPDVFLMYSRMKVFLELCKAEYPTLIFEQVILNHTVKHRWYSNSNGVYFKSLRGGYDFLVMFTSKEGINTSSFNYVSVSTENLSSDLHEFETVKRTIKQSLEQTVTENLTGSFIGDVIVTPECMEDFVSIITGYLRDYHLMDGTSIFKDSLGKIIANERLSLHSKPVSDKLAVGYFFTEDGYKAENSTLIDKGVLNSFLLSLYGSRKTGKEKALNMGYCYVIDSGAFPLDEMVKSIEKGILLCRFSGGYPSSNGDLSGVAKNSYYIENGEIKYPISETMIAGNLRDMLESIKHISMERVNNGDSIIPWITFSGITISGK